MNPHLSDTHNFPALLSNCRTFILISVRFPAFVSDKREFISFYALDFKNLRIQVPPGVIYTNLK